MGNKPLNPKLLSMFGMGGAAFGSYLPDMTEKTPGVLVLSADMSTPAGLDKFKSKFPDRFINVGIAEQNMIGVASGLADEGYKPICEAQSCFLSMRDYEQVRQFCGYMGVPLVLVGISGGLSLTFMGNTHYSLEDFALMRTVPGMSVIAPCDSLEAVKAIDAALRLDTPVYIRLQGGAGWPAVHKSDIDFEIGKAIEMCKGSDAQIIATGSMVGQVMKAAEMLAADGISVTVTDMHTVKPLDNEAIDLDANLIFTIEEHRPVGGLGDAVATFLAEGKGSPRLIKISAPEGFPTVGDYEFLLKECGLTAQQIADKIKTEINKL